MRQRSVTPEQEAEFFAGVHASDEFFMGKAGVQRAIEKLAQLLDETDIPYAVIGAMALNEYGYQRATVDVDVLLTPEGLERFKARWLGRGYVEYVAGGKSLRDTENNVRIDVILAGEYPGDGKPKSVRFPDPSQAGRGEHIRFVPIETLIELKLASGMSAPHRLKDLADVLELIRICKLQPDFGDQLDESVRSKFHELWTAAQSSDQ
jgi:hypothetical protein